MNRTSLLALALLLSACNPDPAGPGTAQTGTGAQLEAAEQLIQKHDYPGAIAVLEAERARVGSEPKLAQRLVDLYKAQGDPSRAILRAREAITQHPDAKTLYVPLAQLLMQVNQLAEAKDVLQKGREAGADDAQISLSLGSCLGKLGDTVGARAEFVRAGKAGLDERTVNYNLALVSLQEKQYTQARDLLEDVVKKNPDWAPAKRELGRLLLEIDPKDQAAVKRGMDFLWSLKDTLKDDWRVFEGMGDGFLIVGDYEAAVTAYTEALRLGQNPKSVEDRYRIAKQKLNEQRAKTAEAPKAPADAQPK
jgi:tetratricopeptide (TPR) repeat protein